MIKNEKRKFVIAGIAVLIAIFVVVIVVNLSRDNKDNDSNAVSASNGAAEQVTLNEAQGKNNGQTETDKSSVDIAEVNGTQEAEGEQKTEAAENTDADTSAEKAADEDKDLPEDTNVTGQPEASETEAGEPEEAGGEDGEADYSEEGIKKYSVSFNSAWKYGSFSAINSGSAVMYENTRSNANNITVCINAGHGTAGGSSVKTLCHPDGSPKVTGGSTASGSTMAAAVSSGMTFLDGTAEAVVTLRMAQLLKEELISNGYSVLMVRDGNDVQLDNIARTVMANNKADCHIALHWDSTQSGKGAFYIGVPDNSDYRSMEPVASNWQKHESLGECLISGIRTGGYAIHGDGRMAIDLTQTSYSTVPSIDLELGDKASDHSDATLKKLAKGIRLGLDEFF